jgi:hypothetical protein
VRARTRLVLVHEFKLLAGNSEPQVPPHVAGRHPVAGHRLVIPAVSLLAEILLPHMREQADALQSSHANMSNKVTISPMTVQSMSCPSTLSISSSLVPNILDSKRLTKLPFGNSVCWLRQLFYS